MITRSNELAGRSGSMQSRIALLVLVTVAGAVYACNSGPTQPTGPTPPNGGTTNGAPVKPGVTTLCKLGPGATFLVRVGVNGPNPTSKTVAVDGGQCVTQAARCPETKFERSSRATSSSCRRPPSASLPSCTRTTRRPRWVSACQSPCACALISWPKV